jgi:hypothetical protein
MPGRAQVLGAHPHLPYVPHSAALARALAQCCLPARPAGLHLRALDVYGLVFARLAVRALASLRRQSRDPSLTRGGGVFSLSLCVCVCVC